MCVIGTERVIKHSLHVGHLIMYMYMTLPGFNTLFSLSSSSPPVITCVAVQSVHQEQPTFQGPGEEAGDTPQEHHQHHLHQCGQVGGEGVWVGLQTLHCTPLLGCNCLV